MQRILTQRLSEGHRARCRVHDACQQVQEQRVIIMLLHDNRRGSTTWEVLLAYCSMSPCLRSISRSSSTTPMAGTLWTVTCLCIHIVTCVVSFVCCVPFHSKRPSYTLLYSP